MLDCSVTVVLVINKSAIYYELGLNNFGKDKPFQRIEIVLCLEEFSINEDFKGIRLNIKMVDCKQNLQESESVLIKRAMAAKIGVEQTTG